MSCSDRLFEQFKNSVVDTGYSAGIDDNTKSYRAYSFKWKGQKCNRRFYEYGKKGEIKKYVSK